MLITSKDHVHRIFMALLAFIILITLISYTLGTIDVTQGDGVEIVHKLFKLFNVDAEENLPTWVSSSLLFLAGLQFALIAYYRHDPKKHDFFHWLFLGLIFLGISFDEFAHVHERAIAPLRDTFHAEGIFYYAWVAPAAVLTIVVAIIYLRFVQKLAPEPRLIFWAACIIYVGGALGMESIGGYYFDKFIHMQSYNYDMGYLTLTHIEEFMEMLGTILFLYVGMYYLQMVGASEFNSQAEIS